MAESTTTKNALAAALKTLTQKTPLEKISVTDICRQCGVNRKSFYYHFQDKYDLVNWIFDTEFGRIAESGAPDDGKRTLMGLLEYLYENRTFYRRVLHVKGQNSFAEHFRELLISTAKSRFQGMFNPEHLEFRLSFFADGFICAIERWLLGRETVSPGKLFGQICSCINDSGELQKALN